MTNLPANDRAEANRLVDLANRHRLIPDGFISPHRVAGYKVAPERHEWTDFALRKVEICRTWLRQMPRTKSPNPRASSSYGFKHDVETWAGEYIYNGAFILACLVEGVPVSRIGSTPNTNVGLSSRASEAAAGAAGLLGDAPAGGGRNTGQYRREPDKARPGGEIDLMDALSAG